MRTSLPPSPTLLARPNLVLIAVFSDVHANLAALEAALRLTEAHGADARYCLGDVVGYGPDPGPCVELVRAHCDGCVLGNHDAAVALGHGTDHLPSDGRRAVPLHRALLSDDQLGWLRILPLQLIAHGATFVHASPDAPAAWQRLEGFRAVRAQFDAFETPFCFVGHSHRPAVAADALGVFKVRPGHRYLVDVGSVGQPRDHDPRLAVGFYDPDAFTYELIRAPYDVEATARRIEAVGLPPDLAARLRRGV